MDSADDAVAYMAQFIPIYTQYRPTPEQAKAGGCVNCTYLGLWADRWPGYPSYEHGIIWLFEEGIRSRSGDVQAQVFSTLIHEMDHALQRDHVLDALERKRSAGLWLPRRMAAMAVRPSPRPCCGH